MKLFISLFLSLVLPVQYFLTSRYSSFSGNIMVLVLVLVFNGTILLISLQIFTGAIDSAVADYFLLLPSVFSLLTKPLSTLTQTLTPTVLE